VDKRKTAKQRIAIQSKTKRNMKTNFSSNIPQVYTECEVEEHVCIFCSEFGKDSELWYGCNGCGNWAHAACTDAESVIGYKCDHFC
jgi:hypothetical protein